MRDDELLHEYVVRHSEQAFAELVARYMGYVYSTAFRLTGDAHLARDVAQTVFVSLARRPKAIRNPRALAGWLYRTTRFTAVQCLRAESRRRQREKAAMDFTMLQPDGPSAWHALATHLDQAMDTLCALDQDAVVMRFFQGKSLREVGDALDLSEDAAQKRVSRALEKLRGYFARQGIAEVSPTVLAGLLAAYASQAAPVGLAASVTTAALAAGSGAVAVVAFTTISTPIVMQYRENARLRQALVTARQARPPAAPVNPRGVDRAARLHLPAPPMPAPTQPMQPPAEELRPTNRISQLLDRDHWPKLSRPQIEAYLDKAGRNADSLLVAFLATRDQALLREAAEKFPLDPRVNFAGWSQSESSEQRRQWLDALKQSAPNNPLPSYLSALEYFKSGQSDLAVQELVNASTQARLEDYSAEAVQGLEEAYRAFGYSDLESKLSAAYDLDQPHLARLRDLGRYVGELATRYREAGDEASAQAALQIGVNLGRQLGEPSGAKLLSHDFAGIAIERQILETMNPATVYDTAGHTVQERLDELLRYREELKRLYNPARGMAGGEQEEVLRKLSEQDLVNYLERLKLFGEQAALRWAATRLGRQ